MEASASTPAAAVDTARRPTLAEANHLLAHYPSREGAMTHSTERTTHAIHDHVL
jgi:hypothetical protein